MVDPVDPIVEALRQARRQQKVTQKDLAWAVCTTQSAISDIESGRVESPRLTTTRKIADALGFDLVLKERG